MPAALRDETFASWARSSLGPAITATSATRYATRALTEMMWRDALPAFSLLWLSDPDQAEHDTSPGSEACLAAVRSSDRNLAIVLDVLEKKKCARIHGCFGRLRSRFLNRRASNRFYR